MEQFKFSQFKKPISNKYNPTTVGLYEIANKIESDPLLRSDTMKAREGGANKLFQLDYVTFSGVFTQRIIDYLERYSDLLCLDIDNIKNPEELKVKIAKSKVPATLMFTSPSGEGLKVVVLVKGGKKMHLSNFNYYESYFRRYFNIQIDRSCKDITRACLLCHDKNVYFKDPEKLDPIELPESRSELFFDFADKYIQNSKDGEKHTRLTKIAYLAGGYCAMGIVGENETLASLKKSIVQRGNLADVDLALKTIDDCFEKGKSAPVSKEDIDKYLSHSENNFDAMVDDVKPPFNPEYKLDNVVYSDSLFNSLPSFLQRLVNKVKNDNNRSSQLYTLLILSSGIFPNIRFSYASSFLSLNLSSLTLAESGSGKSATNLVRELFMGIDKQLGKDKVEGKQKSLILSTNISGSELIHRLAVNDGSVILYDTEISSFLTANSKEWGDYDTMFRQGASNDPIGQYRRDSTDVKIEFPQISIYLTGTPSQITSLFKDKLNGLFSRFMYFTFTGVDYWTTNLIFSEKEDLSKEKELMLEIYKYYKDAEVNLIMKPEAQKLLDNEFSSIFKRYSFDPIIKSSIVRHAVYAWKLCIIIKLFDCYEKGTTDIVIGTEVMELALEIVLKSLSVATDLSFNLDQENLTNGQRIVKLLSQLGSEFTRQEVVQYCGSIFKSTTIDKYLANKSLFTKIDYGKYRLTNPKL